MEALNLGCGDDIRTGWVNLDCAALPGVDIVHDLNDLPLPIDDATFYYVLCQDVLEHVEYPKLLREIWRILKPGGTVHIRVPHFTSPHAYTDPTHKNLFALDTFAFFVNSDNARNYYYDFSFAQMKNLSIRF